MKEALKNEILGEILNTINLPIDCQIIVERIDKKTENVEISIIKKDGTKKILTEKTTKNGFAWCSLLILTLAKIPKVNTTILITDSI